MRAIVVPAGKESVDGSTSGGSAASKRIVVAARCREQPRIEILAANVDESGGKRQRIEVDDPRCSRSPRPAGGRRAAARRKRPSSRVACGASAWPAREQWHRAAIDVDQRARSHSGQPASCRARQPHRRASRSATARRRACRRRAIGYLLAGAADRGQPEHARRAFAEGDRVAADQRQAVAFACGLDAAEELDLPFARAGDGQRQQAAAGVAPLAARSDRLTATSFQPTLAGGIGAAGNERPRRCCRG